MKEPNPPVLTKVELGKPYEVHENGRLTVRNSEIFIGYGKQEEANAATPKGNGN